mgnify:CR=1 FL=1
MAQIEPIKGLKDGGIGRPATDGMIAGVPSLHSSAMDLSQRAHETLRGSVIQAQRPGEMMDARVSQISALHQAHLSELLLQMEEERDRALLDILA